LCLSSPKSQRLAEPGLRFVNSTVLPGTPTVEMKLSKLKISKNLIVTESIATSSSFPPPP
jgi:hypothetical protein